MKQTSALKIESGIPIPPWRHKTGATETLLSMKPGQSVVIPSEKYQGWASVARTKGVKIATRSISDSEKRLWRVS